MERCIAPWATYSSHANILSCITHQLNIKQCHEMTIEHLSFICFVGRLLLDPSASSSSSFMTSSFLIQILKMDKRFFRNWVLHIPHCLRDLLWIVRDWCSVAPIFSSLIMVRASSCVHTSQSLLKVINFLLAHIPQMNGSHDLRRPFKVVITISYSSLIASS